MIIEDGEKENLVLEVNKLIGKGWIPQGGISITYWHEERRVGDGDYREETYSVYAQAMVKKNNG